MLYKYVFGVGAMLIVQYIRWETYCFLYNFINKGIWMHFTYGTCDIQTKTNKQTKRLNNLPESPLWPACWTVLFLTSTFVLEYTGSGPGSHPHWDSDSLFWIKTENISGYLWAPPWNGAAPGKSDTVEFRLWCSHSKAALESQERDQLSFHF